MENYQQSTNPILCANGCGFFGTPQTMNMCSKCYRDFHLTEQNASAAKAAVTMSMTSSSTSPSLSTKTEVVVSSPPQAVVSTAEEVVEKPKNRCTTCNKKVGVMGFKCKCGETFCGSHRYPEEHECEFDFKGKGRDAIAKANPVVKADKLNKV